MTWSSLGSLRGNGWQTCWKTILYFTEKPSSTTLRVVDELSIGGGQEAKLRIMLDNNIMLSGRGSGNNDEAKSLVEKFDTGSHAEKLGVLVGASVRCDCRHADAVGDGMTGGIAYCDC